MARTAEASLPALSPLLGAPPWFWTGVLVAGAPWLRVELADWVLYPGHLGLSVVLLALLAVEGPAVLAALPALAPALLLGGWVALLAALRGQWAAAASAAGTTLLGALWGAAAHRSARSAPDVQVQGEGLVLLLAASLAAGLLAWAAQALWPPLCDALFACQNDARWPFAFHGAWGTHGRWLLVLALLLVPLGPVLAGLLGERAPGPALPLLATLGALGVLSALAGARWWTLLWLALVAGLCSLALAPPRSPGQARLLRAGGVTLLFGLVFVLGLVPGYRALLLSGERPAPRVSVQAAGEAPSLSSAELRPLTLRLHNAGWRSLTASAARPGRLELLLLVTPARGDTRAHRLAEVPLEASLPPDATTTLTVPLRLPHWVNSGYLSWRLWDGSGDPVPLTAESGGFRVTNRAYRRLALDPANRLTALMERARAFRDETHPPPAGEPDPHQAQIVLSEMLDTLVFSPVWGHEAAWVVARPFSAPRPFLVQVLHQYGLVGLGLALWAFWGATSACARLAGGGLGWRLALAAVLALFALAWLVPAPGSYHGAWALFLLLGFVTGRAGPARSRRVRTARRRTA